MTKPYTISNKTVLLVNPPIYDFAAYDFFNKPLGLLYLAGFLRGAGYNVRMVDALDRNHPALQKRFGPIKTKSNGTGKYHSEIIDKPACLAHVPRHYHRYGLPVDILAQSLTLEYQQYKPIAVLITSMMTYWYPAVADTIELIRRHIPDTAIALGGVYARLMPDHARRICRPDMLFTDATMLAPLKWLDELAHANRDYSVIHDQFHAWPAPAYDLYDQLDYLTLITSLGCPFHCDYCASRLLQPHLLQLEPAAFIDQMRKLLPLLGQATRQNIAFMDDALLAQSEKHIIPILHAISRLNLPLHFHCPNGLHIRFISQPLAHLMYANNFQMIRLGYESSDQAARWQHASDDKVSDREFKQAVEHLTKAGFSPAQLEAYLLTGLPGQKMTEIEQSAQSVHQLGLKIRLCQYSPIPGTRLFDVSCCQYGIDPTEPLLHNNTILPALDKRLSYETFQQFKDHVQQLNCQLT